MEEQTTTKRTTQALLRRLQSHIDSCVSEEERKTKERLEWQYEVAKSVSETLRLNEIMLLYYLRNTQFGYTNKFMMIAKKLSEANQELDKIKSTKRTVDKGKRGKVENRN